MDMTMVKIPRCVQPFEVVERQLHHFAETSVRAYRVVTYLRVLDGWDIVTTTLVIAFSQGWH